MNKYNDGGTVSDDLEKKGERTKSVTCKKCSATFENEYQLKEHIDTIQMCNICHRIFNNSTNLLTHLKTHAFMPECDKCKHRFESTIDLINHEENVHKRSTEREPSIRSKPPKK